MVKFNKEQLEVINHKEGNCVVMAGAGSGKSTCLVNRIAKLIESGVNPQLITAITFTKNSANDLKSKLEKLHISDVNVGTFHSICSKILIANGYSFRNSLKEYEIENLFKKVNNGEKTKHKDILSFISYQKAHMRGYNDEFVYKESEYFEEELRVFYKEYEDFKRSKGCLDFDDLLIEAYKLLLVNPDLYKCEYLLIDEAQDNNFVQNNLLNLLCTTNNIMLVGDFRQCLIPTSKIQTVNGEKEIQNITTDDELIVGAGRGEIATIKPEEVMRKHYNGKLIKITTESGKVIECTPNHGVFANRLIKKPYVVYLMHRPGYGFRIGQSSNYRNGKKDLINGHEHRLTCENGDKVWVIKTCETVEEINFYENHFAFKYGIPLYMFKERGGALSQEKIKELFNSIDTIPRGMKLLEDMNMSFENPHYTPKGNSNHVNVKISMNMFGSHQKSTGYINKDYVGYTHELCFSTVDESFGDKARTVFPYIKKRKNGKALPYIDGRRQTQNHDELMEQAYALLDLDENNVLTIKATLTDALDKMDLYPACNIREGMEVALYNGEKIVNELVIKVETYDYDGFVYDINVPYYRNYIANNIVTHNCIYAFRGSKPESFMRFNRLLGDNCRLINLDTNYRSKKNIVDNANEFMKLYYGDYEFYSDSISNNKTQGEVQIVSTSSEDEEAVRIAEEIKTLLDNGCEPKEISVLYRLNKQSHLIENELKLRGIEYDIHNSSNFFNRKEIDIIMCMLRLIHNPSEDMAFETLLRYRVIPYLPNSVIEDIIRTASRLNISMLEASEIVEIKNKYVARELSDISRAIDKLMRQEKSGVELSTIVNHVINIIDLKTYIENNYSTDEEIEERLASIESFKKFIRNNTLESFLSYVYDKSTTQKKKTGNKVQLMTLHGSKGLEFENVFMIGINDGKFPNAKAEILDESRLMYVGVTRAKTNLWLSSSADSTFIREYKMAI